MVINKFEPVFPKLLQFTTTYVAKAFSPNPSRIPKNLDPPLDQIEQPFGCRELSFVIFDGFLCASLCLSFPAHSLHSFTKIANSFRSI